ncbi:MAG: sigma-70 family RNA polymerase sigma factor [Phycisphaerales bacterium]|nr:sigma-70 family RNA polymerase sigma factor [Phycisphaerales bacterium]MCB9863443.1 sigma-70 family RNA polymerase sigma factor [Phycisphaerales bacterium]
MSDFDSGQSDAELLEAIRAGRHDAYQQLSDRYWAAIHRFAASYLHDDARAEDVTQETFAKLTDADTLPDGDIKPWLYKVARNKCLDILRRWQRSPTHNRNMKTGFDVARQTAGPQTRMARDERRELIRQIIADMPEEYRSVLTLKHFEGMSRSEMAVVLEITEIAVKGRLVRASDYLRDQLRRYSGIDQ